MPVYKTEDDVKDEVKKILGFDDVEKDVVQGTGQHTTFNLLYENNKSFGFLKFQKIADEPDGWYLPKDKGAVAIIVETKKEKENIGSVTFFVG